MKAMLRDPRKRIWLAAGTLLVVALAVTAIVVYSHGGNSPGYSY